jgi:hypothetical protein
MRYILLLVVSSIILLLSPRDRVDWLFPLLLGLLIVMSNSILKKNTGHAWLVHPSTMILNYIGLSVFLGAIAFSFDLVAIQKDLSAYKAWSYYNYTSTIFILLIGAFVMGSCQRNLRVDPESFVPRRKRILYLILLPWFTFFFVPLNLNIIGGSGDFAIVIKTILAIFFIYRISNFEFSIARWLLYFGIIFVFALFSIQEKREAIFLLFPMVYLEITKGLLQFTVRSFFLSILTIFFIATLILSMSIGRGYGDFGEDLSLLESFGYIDDYIKSPEFVIYFAQNIETNYTFFHSLNSMELVLLDSSHLSYGSTFWKVFLIPFPRSIFPFKPDSILELYTSAYASSFRSIGGSWVVSVFSEFVWNFSILGVGASYLFGRLMGVFNHKLSSSVLKNDGIGTIRLLFTYTILFTYVRGSGLDQFVLYWLIGISVIFYYQFLKKVF